MCRGRLSRISDAAGEAFFSWMISSKPLARRAHLATSRTELIQGYVMARQFETTEAELTDTVFAHPTLSEMPRV